jgi:signal-transduction protein with cAMP-binding, CBS, and nucleotidyltransferase domain
MTGTALPSSTALAALPAVSLDLETTGLDVRSARIVQAGVVTMLGPRILDEPRLDSLVRPGVPIPVRATHIHRIDDAAVAGAPPFAELAPRLLEMLAGRVVVGHNIAFDLAVLRHEAARAQVPWRNPPALDVGLLFGSLEPSEADVRLESLAARLGVPVRGRHHALGDALMAAAILGKLLARLRELDVRTLGEAQVFAARRQDLIRSQIQAGWHSMPAGRKQALERAPARIDSYIFERRVDDVMSAPLVMVRADATLREAAEVMAERRIGAVLVGKEGSSPEGIITERDVMRATAGGSVSVQVREVMSAPVQSIGAGEPLYRALGRMDGGGFRHLCVVDAAGRAIGMLSQRDLLRHRARASLSLGDDVARADDAVALAAAFGKVAEVAERLVAEGVGAVEVARMVSGETRALTGRVAEIVQQRLAAAGRPAPARWCLLVLGSAGRSESLLSLDQDNALIHAGEPADDSWFAEFGEAVANLLDEAGLPRCKGGVMAANAEWRGTRTEWRQRVGAWLRGARPQDLLNVDIFFDLMPVAGEAGLARELHADAVAAAEQSRTFIALLAESVGNMTPSIGLFGTLRTEAGRIDLKRGALLPLVGLARTLALRAGSLERSTPARLQAASAAERISAADVAVLTEAHADLLDLVLKQQLADLARGIRPSTRVETRPLGRARARQLARELRRLEEILRNLRGAVAG